MGDFELRTKFRNAANAPVRVLGRELFKNEGARKIIATFYWLPSLFLLGIATVLHLNDWSCEPTVVKVGVTLWHVLLLLCALVMIFNKNPGEDETTGKSRV